MVTFGGIVLFWEKLAIQIIYIPDFVVRNKSYIVIFLEGEEHWESNK